MPPVEPARLSHRLTSHYRPGRWTGVVVHAIEEAVHDVDGTRIATPHHYLGAAWAPADGAPTRFPDVVVIGSPGADNALAQLLVHIPRDAKLWLAGRDDVDVALAAEILLVADRNLERYQRDAITAFIATERERARAAIAARYSDRDDGFERFRAMVVGRGNDRTD